MNVKNHNFIKNADETSDKTFCETFFQDGWMFHSTGLKSLKRVQEKIEIHKMSLFIEYLYFPGLLTDWLIATAYTLNKPNSKLKLIVKKNSFEILEHKYRNGMKY